MYIHKLHVHTCRCTCTLYMYMYMDVWHKQPQFFCYKPALSIYQELALDPSFSVNTLLKPISAVTCRLGNWYNAVNYLEALRLRHLSIVSPYKYARQSNNSLSTTTQANQLCERSCYQTAAKAAITKQLIIYDVTEKLGLMSIQHLWLWSQLTIRRRFCYCYYSN